MLNFILFSPSLAIPESYLQGLSDPEVRKFMAPVLKSWTIERAQAYILDNWMAGNAIFYRIHLGDKFIGTVRLHDVDFLTKSGTIGIALFDKSEWRKGYATKALQFILRYGTSRGLTTFKAGIHPDNIASQRLFEKCGFHWGLWPSEKKSDEGGNRIYFLRVKDNLS